MKNWNAKMNETYCFQVNYRIYIFRSTKYGYHEWRNRFEDNFLIIEITYDTHNLQNILNDEVQLYILRNKLIRYCYLKDVL